jgi:hypothetical protein
MSLKSEILADVHSPSLPVSKIHPMIKRAVQIAEGFDPSVPANLPSGVDTIQEAIDALAARETVATGQLTAAQVIAATTAHDLLAAPGAGKVNIVKKVELFLDYAAAFTSGSDFSILYETTSAAVAAVDVASITGTADVAYLIVPSTYASTAGTGGSFSATANANKKLQLLVSGAAYADGAGSVLKYRITYETVTLLS